MTFSGIATFLADSYLCPPSCQNNKRLPSLVWKICVLYTATPLSGPPTGLHLLVKEHVLHFLILSSFPTHPQFLNPSTVELIVHHQQNLISSLFSEYFFLLLAQKSGFALGTLLSWQPSHMVAIFPPTVLQQLSIEVGYVSFLHLIAAFSPFSFLFPKNPGFESHII